MTIKPSRTSTPNVVGEQKLPAAMMTIPDFCWQPAMIVRKDNVPETPLPEPTPECVSSTDSPPLPELDRAVADRETAVHSPEVVRQERTGLVTIDLGRLKDGLRRHWLPVGGVAIALLWIASVLTSGGDTPQERVAPPGPRQARRETTPKVTPLAEGQLRAPRRQAPERAPSPTPDGSSGPASQVEEQQRLFENVPALSNLPQDERPDAELPAIPTLNPPSGTPAAVDSVPAPAPAVGSDQPAASGVDFGAPQTVEARGPGDAVPVADEPAGARETEYEWGTPNRPTTRPASPRDLVREANDSSKSSSATASDSRTVPPGRPAYRQTDPASYKDPLYVIPPLARQPRASGYR